MPEKEFNLIEEPWIRVMRPNGKTEEVSLRDVFEHAHEFRGLAGELPTQDVAVLRLLLAVLHSVFGRYDADGNESPIFEDSANGATPRDALNRWKGLWDAEQFPAEIINGYLSEHEERFWLFHPEMPFGQIRLTNPIQGDDGEKINPSDKTIKLLIGDMAESENTKAGTDNRLFLHRRDIDAIEYGEAARWLLYNNLFDVAPGGRPAKGQIKGYGLAWGNELGLIWPSGKNLFETLMLNLVFDSNSSRPSPFWEKDIIVDSDYLNDKEPSIPTNQAELLTMPFRKMELIRNADCKNVIGYRLWSGVHIDSENAFQEQMTLWIKGKNERSYIPKKHRPSRQMWRDFGAMLASTDSSDRAPGCVSWIIRLREKKYISPSNYAFNIAGAETRKNTAMADVFFDAMSFHSDLLSDKLGNAWASRILNELKALDALIEKAGLLALNIDKAKGKSYIKYNQRGEPEFDYDAENKYKETVKEDLYFRMDEPFRKWISGINPNVDMDDKCTEWKNTSRGIVQSFGRALFHEAGQRAFIGHEYKVKLNGVVGRHRYTSPEAYNDFVKHLYRTEI
jgi:CRISPR system Cascade subunit CasA